MTEDKPASKRRMNARKTGRTPLRIPDRDPEELAASSKMWKDYLLADVLLPDQKQVDKRPM
jgi:hypothetical protein